MGEKSESSIQDMPNVCKVQKFTTSAVPEKGLIRGALTIQQLKTARFKHLTRAGFLLCSAFALLPGADICFPSNSSYCPMMRNRKSRIP